MDTIFFFGPDNAYGFLSNFYRQSFIVDGMIFSCVEQYMHFCKARLMGDIRTSDMIMNVWNPKEMKRLGRMVKNFDPALWDKNKVDVVFKGVYNKFEQNDELKKLLLETEDKYLAEANPWDRIWGIGDRNTPREEWGENLLGEILMKVRTKLREHK